MRFAQLSTYVKVAISHSLKAHYLVGDETVEHRHRKIIHL